MKTSLETIENIAVPIVLRMAMDGWMRQEGIKGDMSEGDKKKESAAQRSLESFEDNF